MMTRKWLVLGVVVAAILSWSEVEAVVAEDSPYVEIWTDRGEGGLYREGDCVDVFVRPAIDCYVIIYDIDTDGYLRVLYPYDCTDSGYLLGGRIYRIGRGGHRRFYASGPRGVEYIHVVASLRPFRRVYWHGCHGYEDYAYDVSWRGFSDYWGCALPPRIYGDPYIAMQSIDEFICLDGLAAGIVWANFTYFYVHERVSYPRYVCYDCHGFSPYVRPYAHVCTAFSITFVDCDPWYRPCTWWWWCSPKRVYCGPRYVCDRKKPCGDWPSQYKWKSRTETVGHREPIKLTGGPTAYEPRAKVKQKGGDLDLYSGGRNEVRYKDPAGRQTEVPNVRKVPATAEKVKAVDRDVKVRPQPVRQTEVRERVDRPSKAQQGESALTKLRKAVTSLKQIGRSEASKADKAKSGKKKEAEAPARASSARSKEATKQVAPKVRTKNQGRSPATRRGLSR